MSTILAIRTCADLDFSHLGMPAGVALQGRFRRAMVRAWLQQFGEQCLFCERRMNPSQAGRPFEWMDCRPTIDHIDAICLGGADKASNMQVICWWCNNLKARAESEAFVTAIRTGCHPYYNDWAETKRRAGYE